MADLVDWLGSVDAGDVAATLAERFVANRTPLLEGQLLEVAALAEIDDDTPVERRASAVAALRVDESGHQLRLVLGDRIVVLPAPVEPAVRRLLDGTSRPVGELADMLDHPSRLVLVRRLVREGALRTAPPDG